MARIDALRDRIAEQGLGLVDSEGRVTVSAGVARCPEDGAAPTPLLHRADLRTLEAKWAGRNRVVGPSAEERRAAPTGPLVRDVGELPPA